MDKNREQARIEKIVQLTKAIIDNPFEGIGKPEALKHELSGYWSRRINGEDRLVYTILDGELIIQSLKGHY